MARSCCYIHLTLGGLKRCGPSVFSLFSESRGQAFCSLQLEAFPSCAGSAEHRPFWQWIFCLFLWLPSPWNLRSPKHGLKTEPGGGGSALPDSIAGSSAPQRTKQEQKSDSLLPGLLRLQTSAQGRLWACPSLQEGALVRAAAVSTLLRPGRLGAPLIHVHGGSARRPDAGLGPGER